MKEGEKLAKHRGEDTKPCKTRINILVLTNCWILYLIYLTFIPITNNTYSCLNDIEKISNSIAAAGRFNINDDDSKNHDKEGKDNSGIGNGPEPGDSGQHGDSDNPGKGNGDKKEDVNDDHPKSKTEIYLNDDDSKNHDKEGKDNSGIGNGPEPGDSGQHGDSDNPGKGNGDNKEDINADHPEAQAALNLDDQESKNNDQEDEDNSGIGNGPINNYSSTFAEKAEN